MGQNVISDSASAGRASQTQAWTQVASWAQARARMSARLGKAAVRYAMNMRAAEATVSNAPKAMKILPISEV